MLYRLLCPSFRCKIPHECEDITKNAWRTPQSTQYNIEHRSQYSLLFTFLNYHRISIIFLLFWVSIPNPGCNNRKLLKRRVEKCVGMWGSLRGGVGRVVGVWKNVARDAKCGKSGAFPHISPYTPTLFLIPTPSGPHPPHLSSPPLTTQHTRNWKLA